ncbi:nicotinamide-nucleotide amidohydrolase family protein [Yanghanlia caeni]|uniref:Nicotinamide-nucleotide amidohydrolase family protein n=1 Tax=Yanghanlia caeni TaxID=3064283 RepID=A0ABU1D911_9BURK|nr:nicotinamide-nucleotide amidohydrolase family protein [Alcaligenaceae bacterium LG-2]NGR08181.1 nicotinamide-nucleotide amidohydrolase family protein [bacterium SGD-2]HZH55990.1 nicotinamide-nucleotide amidohydrolase family protein [Burkholderiaceae bacterium]
MTSTDTQQLSRSLGERLLDRGWMLSCAESCTGGLLAAAITDIPGSSQWFDRGLVTYSNAAKRELLGVHAETLERFGAVSEETAMEMAAGVLAAASGSDFAVSTTGIAGPDGGTPGKPVGMVCFGFATRTAQGVVTRAETRVFAGDRQAVRAAAVNFALSTALQFTPAD